MSVGPVEYLVVAFPGNRFRGEIAPAISELVESGTIHIIDFAFIHKAADGEVHVVELEQEDSDVVAAFQALAADRGGIISEEDLYGVAEALEPESSALVAVWEDVWAARLSTAIRDAGGLIVTMERISGDVVEAALAWHAE